MLEATAAPVLSLMLTARQARPYPPGNFRINGAPYPATISSAAPEVSITWSHRDRIVEADQLIDTAAGNIGPEPGTTYRVRFYSPAGLAATVAITAGSFYLFRDRAEAVRQTLSDLSSDLEEAKKKFAEISTASQQATLAGTEAELSDLRNTYLKEAREIAQAAKEDLRAVFSTVGPETRAALLEVLNAVRAVRPGAGGRGGRGDAGL